MRSARPTTSPACGPPTSLSPLNVTRSAPAARRSAGVGSWARPKRAVSSSAPMPRSSTTIAPCAVGRGRPARAASGASVNPVWRKFEGWTRRTSRARPSASGASKSATRVRFVVPTSMSRRPGPPDDLRDPDAAADLDQLAAADDHAAARPARPTASATRRRVVVRDERVLGAGQRDEVLLGRPEAGAAPAGLAVELEEQVVARPLRRRIDRRLAATARARGSCGRSRRSR